MTKTERQDIGINKYLKAGAIGALDYTMRFGKTLTGLKIAAKFRTKFPHYPIWVVVPSINIKNEWEKAISNGYSKLGIKVYIIDYLINNNITDTIGLLIVYKLHKFTSDTRFSYINDTKIKSSYRLGLTGTYPYGNKNIEKLYPVIDVITETEALENNWISNFTEYNIPLELTDDDKLEYIKYSKIISECLVQFRGLHETLKYTNGKDIFNSDLSVIYACYTGFKSTGGDFVKPTSLREYIATTIGWKPNLDLSSDYNKRLEEEWHPDKIKEIAVKFKNAIDKRNQIHNNNQVKLQAMLRLYDYYKDKTIITFNESIMFAEILTDAINTKYNKDKAVVYYSTIDSKPLINFVTNDYFYKKSDGKVKVFGKLRQLKYILEMLKIGKYNIINTIKALDEGLNIPNIDLIITTSGTSNPMQYTQRSARGKTVDIYNPNKITIIINLYFDDFSHFMTTENKIFKSRDKSKLLERQQNKDVKIVTLDEIIEN